MSIRQGSTIIAGSSGSGGTSNYNDLKNKPSINGITLEGNKTTEDLNINSLPDQTGNEGKVLITNGTEASWQTLPETGLPLFAHIWSDHLLTNSSYLRADTFSWQDGNIYYTAYNELVNEKNLTTETSTDTINNITITYYRTPKGYKIVLPDMADTIAQLYESTGTAWYYILDTDNTRFKLPRNSRYESGTTTENAGDFGAESLPNIQGSVKPISFDADGSYSENGAFYTEGESVNGPVSDSSATSVRTLMFSASRSSSTYKDGAKVNPDHVTQFLYFYVGNTIQNETTINVAEITEALNNKADRDFGNITDGTYDFLTTKQITNCITKIPQDIKLEINNGNIVAADTCTVYKGDGSTYTIPASTSFTHASSAGTFMLIWTGSAARHQNINTCFSGNTAPVQGSFSGSYAVWYDTTNKVIKLTNDGGSTWIGDNSFPLCIYKLTGTSTTSIEQVFNGFGFIGSTIFALPGIEGLVPNGRNIDGSLNNTKFTTTKVSTRTYGSNETYPDAYLIISSSQFTTSYAKYYNDKNLIIDASGRILPYANCGMASFENGRITAFSPNNTFQAVDRNDTEWASTASKPSDKYVDLTLGASGTQYTAPANGYFTLQHNADAGVIMMLNSENGIANYANILSNDSVGFNGWVSLTAKKGNEITIYYKGATGIFRFVYDEGSK